MTRGTRPCSTYASSPASRPIYARYRLLQTEKSPRPRRGPDRAADYRWPISRSMPRAIAASRGASPHPQRARGISQTNHHVGEPSAAARRPSPARPAEARLAVAETARDPRRRAGLIGLAGIAPDVANQTLRALRDAGIIEHHGRGDWRIFDPLLRRTCSSFRAKLVTPADQGHRSEMARSCGAAPRCAWPRLRAAPRAGNGRGWSGALASSCSSSRIRSLQRS